jgi:heme-degrading monooxygenase HmoA
MVAVIFEVIPAEGKAEEYLNIASDLGEALQHTDGFISIERFRSVVNPEKFLSLSFWENEDSVEQWRNLQSHRQAQSAGRNIIFEDYRLRVAHVCRDYGMFDRTQAPQDSQTIHDKK